MKSVKSIYKIGKGPSSSHTMGPERAAKLFFSEHPEADSFRATLYGSLSDTGRGHMTDRAIMEAFLPKTCEVVFSDVTPDDLPHENTMDFFAYLDGSETGFMRAMSIGGGDIAIAGRGADLPDEVYKENSFAEVAEFCAERNIRISDYVELNEGKEIRSVLAGVWAAMQRSISEGLTAHGVLPGGLEVERKAQTLFNQRHMDERESTRENRLVCAYAFAVSEQNADCGTIVTAPTCGSAGVLPSVLKYMQEKRGFDDDSIIRALEVAGVIGNLVKRNASVSGAECGCQAEIGTACSMAAAALAELYGMGIGQIEYAAEVAMEHHLGLTCDPIRGLVQIPCIERNAVAAMRAINAVSLANFLSNTRKISFDLVVKTMYQTGKDMHRGYRETSESGLAKLYSRD